MKKTYSNSYSILLVLLVILSFACSKTEEKKVAQTEQEKLVFKIDSLNNVLSALSKDGKIDIKTTMYIVQTYEYYAHDYPKDEKSGYYLMKAGELYENVLNDKQRAIRRYQSAFLSEIPFESQPMALFRSANLYADLGDTTKAISTFKLFIEKYPTHDFADDAENMINITRIGIDEFIKQSSAKNPA